MTSTDVHTHASNGTAPMSGSVEMKLEMVVMPVSDAGRAKEFHTNLGWRLDADFLISDDFRVVRCSAMLKPLPGVKLGGRSPTELVVFGRQSSPSGTAQARSGCADCSGERRSGERFRTMGESSRAAGADAMLPSGPDDSPSSLQQSVLQPRN